ncbi:FAD/NAD(P)-binding protein [Spirosoma oryzicola]|uniref:FAD/NAD(P)-binding protein n=1 Tax=Spirosoma oryzicola TaxID=2898794 RepID=UPI001E6253AA|nr:FAD/NAD(P)-binding protein [Spirosoma oryzicola]UHG92701.1 FAD/NAD(P)-binding protein [Spirosoma oryzicola]
MDQQRIAIVGGGACGTATFIHLVLKLIVTPESEPVSFALIEKRDEIGPGLAYGTGQKGHLLNTSAGLMGIFAQEQNHFVEWMASHRELIDAEYPDIATDEHSYPPRELYGIYLKETFEEYVELARQHGMTVDLYHELAVDAAITEEGATVTLESGQIIEADVLVLATGTPKSNTFNDLESSPNYLDSPWPAGRILDTITDKDASVCVLGASLTAIDAIITLVNNGHRGPIKLYSKDGLIPRVQSPEEKPFDRKELTIGNVRRIIREQKRALRASDLFRLFRAEVERIKGPLDWKQFRRIGKSQLDLLNEDIEQALQGDSIFQNILYSTRYSSFAIWQLLPQDERIRFSKWLKPYSDINRHAIPLQNAYKLRDLLASGQVTVTAYSDEVTWDDKTRRFTMTTEKGFTDEADYVINATGPATKAEKMLVPVLERLLKKNQLVPCEAGGVQADVNTMQLYVPNMGDAPAYGIGHLLVGELFDTNSVWFNVARIDPLTQSIIKRIQHERTERVAY